jgi:hypothetical protein
LLGAAVVGGVAYHAGKKRNQAAQQEADQNAQIDDLQQQQQQQQYQQAPPQAAPAEAPAADEDPMAKLTQLKGLLDQGVLTQAEFDFQKTKILQSM